jgi:hypothetical protein
MQLLNNFREDLQEVARLVSAITEAHSAAIFLPTDILSEVFGDTSGERSGSIDLVAVHSHSKLVKDCRVQVGHGLLGWVAEQGRPIHLTPCDVSSSALSLYADQEPIKSLVAVPIVTHNTTLAAPYLRTASAAVSGSISSLPYGVLMCDSTRVDGFSNTQVKVLEQFASVIQRLLCWVKRSANGAQVETSWELFKQKTAQLGDAIGHSSIELLRIRLDSLGELETKGGLSLAVQLSEQFLRLAQQAVPPHFPCIRLPDGDVALAVDDMMSGFFQQKLQTLANHLSTAERPLQISIECYRARLAAGGQCNVDVTLQQQPISVKNSTNLGGVRA